MNTITSAPYSDKKCTLFVCFFYSINLFTGKQTLKTSPLPMMGEIAVQKFLILIEVSYSQHGCNYFIKITVKQ